MPFASRPRLLTPGLHTRSVAPPGLRRPASAGGCAAGGGREAGAEAPGTASPPAGTEARGAGRLVT